MITPSDFILIVMSCILLYFLMLPSHLDNQAEQELAALARDTLLETKSNSAEYAVAVLEKDILTLKPKSNPTAICGPEHSKIEGGVTFTYRNCTVEYTDVSRTTKLAICNSDGCDILDLVECD